MTDTATEERAPRPAGQFNRDRTCEYCGKHFEGGWAAARHGRHVKVCPENPAVKSKAASAEKKAAEKLTGGTGEKKPTPPRRRESLERFGEYLYEGLSFAAAKTGRMAASRMYRVSSAAFGPALEKSVTKGSRVDKALQPLARIANQSPETAALIAAPITAEAFLARPSPMTQAAFVGAVAGAIEPIINSAKAKIKEQAKLEADLSAFSVEFGKAPGEPVTLVEFANWVAFSNIYGPEPEPPRSPDDVPVDAEVVG